MAGESDSSTTELSHISVWSKDGITATDEGSGKVFDLRDPILSTEIIKRAQALCPSDTTLVIMLEENGINETSQWVKAVENNDVFMEECHIQAFAEAFNVSEFALLSGEGLNLPDVVVETAEASLVDDATDKAPEAQPEVVLPEESAVATATEVDTEAVFEAIEAQPCSTAIQVHFRQRLLSEDFGLAEGVSPRTLLAATQASHVDWVTVYFTMTDVGVHTLEQVHALAEQFGGEPSLNSEIVNRILSMSRIR